MSGPLRYGQAVLSVAVAVALATSVVRAETSGGATYPIDLPTVLRLAGAQNLDVQIARELVSEADAKRISALEKFFPWLTAGVAYHRRDGMAQAVPAGTISNTHFDSYAPGGAVTAQVVLGDAIYDSLVARQLVRASDHALDTQRQDSTLAAAQGYFDLARAAALVSVARQALETSLTYQRQLHEAVALGIAFKGDELRVQTQTERYEIAQRQAVEGQRVAAAALAQVLHLDPAVELVPQDTGLVPRTLFATDASAQDLVRQALSARPEVKRNHALISAARASVNGAVYGPLLPSVGAQAFVGGLGGGHDNEGTTFGASEDYLVGLSWRIGPGGLFDPGRIDTSKARLAAVQLGEAKIEDSISADVIESVTRVQSLSDQLAPARRSLAAAEETLHLTRARKQYGVGIVLEDLQAQQALNQARTDYVATIAEFNKAQYRLNRAVGGPTEPQSLPPGNDGPAAVPTPSRRARATPRQ